MKTNQKKMNEMVEIMMANGRNLVKSAERQADMLQDKETGVEGPEHALKVAFVMGFLSAVTNAQRVSKMEDPVTLNAWGLCHEGTARAALEQLGMDTQTLKTAGAGEEGRN